MTAKLNIDESVKNNFDFLNTEYGFKGPHCWNIAYELEFTYVKGIIFFNVSYDGAFFFVIGETKKIFRELETGEIKINEIDRREKNTFDLFDLLSKKERNELLSKSNDLNVLADAAEILKSNHEILKGNWNNFSKFKKIFKR